MIDQRNTKKKIKPMIIENDVVLFDENLIFGFHLYIFRWMSKFLLFIQFFFLLSATFNSLLNNWSIDTIYIYIFFENTVWEEVQVWPFNVNA